MKRLTNILMFAAVILSSSYAWALTWFVNIDGSDTTCNGKADASAAVAPNCAFRTVQKGVNAAVAPGDIVNIRGDHSSEGLIVTKADGCTGFGCADNPTYISIQTNPAAVQYSGIISPGIMVKHSYIIVNGLGITKSSGYSSGLAGVTLGWPGSTSSYCRITNNHFYNPISPILSGAVYIGEPAHYNVIDHNLIEGDTNPVRVTGHHTGTSGTTLTDSYYTWQPNQWVGRSVGSISSSAGIVISNDAHTMTTSKPIVWGTDDCYFVGTSFWIPFVIAGTDNTISNNTIRNLSNTERVFDGLADNTVISGNEVSDLLNGNELPEGSRLVIDNCYAHPDIFQVVSPGHSQNVVIENNYFHDLQSQTGMLEGNNVSDWKIRNNIFANITERNSINGRGFKFYNNTVFNVSWGDQTSPFGWNTGIEYKNNIIIGGSKNPNYGSIDGGLYGNWVECARNVITQGWLANTNISHWWGQGGTQAVLMANGSVYVSTNGGTNTGNAAPNWRVDCPNAGDTCADNGITWTNTVWNTNCTVTGTKDVIFGNQWGSNVRRNVMSSFVCSPSCVDGGDPRIYDAAATKKCWIKDSADLPVANNYYGIWNPPTYSSRTASFIDKILGDRNPVNGGNPQFVAAYENCVANTCDFHLQPTSPLIGKGVDLLSMWSSAKDKDGIARPQGAVWDIGAYEFAQNGSGDVSADGRVTMYDAALVLQYTVGGTLTTTQQEQADINGDAAIDAADALAIGKKALGIN